MFFRSNLEMNILTKAVVLILFTHTYTSVTGTLSHAKSVTNQQSPRLNNIAKLIKKDKEVEVIITPAPPVTSTTLKPSWSNRNDLNGNFFDPVDANSRTHKVAELAIVIGGVTILIVILVAALRTCYFVYNKVKKLANPPSSSVVYRNTHHPLAPGTQPVGPPGPSIYTVMPGHFVLQPCFTSRSAPPVAGSVERPQHQQVPFSTESSDRPREENACVVTVVRPETPPPPYPGYEK